MIREKNAKKVNQAELKEDLPRRFRITTDDIPKILNEFQRAGFIKSKDRKKVKFDF